MNVYTIRYLTVLGEIRTATHEATTPENAKASFIAHQIHRDDAGAAALDSVQVYESWPLYAGMNA